MLLIVLWNNSKMATITCGIVPTKSNQCGSGSNLVESVKDKKLAKTEG
jgi:hypothetical protein